jgi:DTW domain-containing protein YfiP
MNPLVPEPSRRPRCAHCGLPVATCLCNLVVRVDNAVEVLVLQHPREVREAKGSARLLGLSLARCRIVVGEVFDADVLDALLHGAGRRSVLLYPEAGRAEAGPAEDARARPTQLVVLDGTWRKSLRMLMSNPALQGLPRWPLAPAEPGVYGALRKARLPTQLSTLEATCTALALLDGDAARYAPLLAAFGRFVDERAAFAAPT